MVACRHYTRIYYRICIIIGFECTGTDPIAITSEFQCTSEFFGEQLSSFRVFISFFWIEKNFSCMMEILIRFFVVIFSDGILLYKKGERFCNDELDWLSLPRD